MANKTRTKRYGLKKTRNPIPGSKASPWRKRDFMEEAADEITRFQGEVEHLRYEVVIPLQHQNDILRRRIKELEKALTTINVRAAAIADKA